MARDCPAIAHEKLFETCVKDLLRRRGWTKVHILKTGFQPKSGALEALFAADDVTRHYVRKKKLLLVMLLDIQKAYDRTTATGVPLPEIESPRRPAPCHRH